MAAIVQALSYCCLSVWPRYLEDKLEIFVRHATSADAKSIEKGGVVEVETVVLGHRAA